MDALITGRAKAVSCPHSECCSALSRILRGSQLREDTPLVCVGTVWHGVSPRWAPGEHVLLGTWGWGMVSAGSEQRDRGRETNAKGCTWDLRSSYSKDTELEINSKTK